MKSKAILIRDTYTPHGQRKLWSVSDGTYIVTASIKMEDYEDTVAYWSNDTATKVDYENHIGYVRKAEAHVEVLRLAGFEVR